MDNQEKVRVNTSPIPSANASGLKSVFRSLKPMIEEAKVKLSQLPLRPIIDTFTYDEVMVRFATAEELQRIVMRCFKGRIIVDTLPARMHGEPAVIGQIKVLTPSGYISLPGAAASQDFGMGAVDVGAKQLLSAETKAIRRTLRELGLRAEYEEYDDHDNRQNSDSKNTKSPASVKAKRVEVDDIDDIDVGTETKAASVVDVDADDDIPSMPDDAFDSKAENEKSDEKGKPAAKRGAKQNRNTGKSSAAKGKATTKKASTKAPTKEKNNEPLDIKVPAKERNVSVEREHESWPNINSLRYQNDLLNGLNKARDEFGLTVESMAKSFFGKDHEAHRRLGSYTTVEMEKMYQFYVIQKAK